MKSGDKKKGTVFLRGRYIIIFQIRLHELFIARSTMVARSIKFLIGVPFKAGNNLLQYIYMESMLTFP
jgi:hypothetical protein